MHKTKYPKLCKFRVHFVTDLRNALLKNAPFSKFLSEALVLHLSGGGFSTYLDRPQAPKIINDA